MLSAPHYALLYKWRANGKCSFAHLSNARNASEINELAHHTCGVE